MPTNTFSYIGKKIGLTNTSEKAIDLFANSLVDYIFYGRKNVFYNHNLSAQAEAKIATEKGIHFYAVDVTKNDEQKNKFDDYLKKMSGDKGEFLNIDENVAEKFKDVLTKVTLVDTIENDVEIIGGLNHPKAKLTTPSSSSWFSLLFSSSKKTITLDLNKADLIKAYQTNEPISLTYQLKYKGKKNSNSQKLVSTEISHTINDKNKEKKYSSKITLNHETKKVLVPVSSEPKDTDKVVDKSTGISKVENMTPMVTPEIPKQTEPNVPDSTLPMQPELPKETGKPGNNVEPESSKPIENSTDDSANKPDSTTPKTTDNIIIPNSTLPMQPESPKETGKSGNNVEPESPKPIEDSTDDSANKPDSTIPKATDNIIIPNPTLPMKPDSTEETEKPGNNVEPELATPKATDNIIIPNSTFPMKPDSTEEIGKTENSVKPESPKPIEDTDSSAGTQKLDIPKVMDTPDLSRPMKPESTEEIGKAENSDTPDSSKTIKDSDNSAPISTIKDKVNAETVANQVELAMNQKSRLSENMEKVSSVNRSNEKSRTLPSTGQADSPIYTLTALSLLVGAQVLYRTKRKQESK